MKKRFLLLLFTALTAGALFASSQKEDSNGAAVQAAEDLISVEGAVAFDEYGSPYIENDGVTYLLRIPAFISGIPEVNEGDVISVEGYAGPLRGYWTSGDVKRLMVVKAVINGEELEIETLAGDCPYVSYGGRYADNRDFRGMPKGRTSNPRGGGFRGR